MDLLANDYPDVIVAARAAPCLSLYQPTHRQHPENAQDPIRFGNLVKQLAQSLEQKYPRCEAASLLAPLHALRHDMQFWKRSLDGLAVLVAPDFLRVYRLQRTVSALAVVADRFHTKPLMRIAQSADRYQVLGLNRSTARLFEGNRDRLDEIELAPEVPRTLAEAMDRDVERDRAIRTFGPIRAAAMGRHGASDVKQDGIHAETEHYFRAVDRAVLEYHSRPTGLPLLLAAMPEHQHLLRKVSRNPQLLATGIDVHPDSLALDALCERAWQVMQPSYLARLAGLVERYAAAIHRGQATDNLTESAKAAAAARVSTLLLEADRRAPGRLNMASGEITLGRLDDPHADDVLDDLGEQVVASGGETVVVPAERMPTRTGLAAIYRF